MKSFGRLIAASVLAMGFSLGMTALPAVAQASPTCYGNSCDGLDPAKANCLDDAITLDRWDAKSQLGENIGNLEMRYSPKCHANWARFTPWYGISSQLGNLTAEAQADGSPWIWRLGVANSLRGVAGTSSLLDIRTVTKWTAMVTADGKTCSSVELYETGHSSSGQGDRRPLGPFNAPCIS